MLLRLLSLLRARLPRFRASDSLSPARAVTGRGSPVRKRSPTHALEPLESRIAPATFLNPHTVTYTDIDGDHVTVYSSLPIFIDVTTKHQTANVDSIFTFNTGSVNGSNTTPQQLQSFDLSNISNSAGDSITFSVVNHASSDSFSGVGLITSPFSLGHVTVPGNIGASDAGVSGQLPSTYVGLAGLSVGSLGAAVQPSSGNLLSTIFGAVGSITVQHDMANAQLVVTTTNTSGPQNGKIGSLFIGGNLVGGANSTTLLGDVVTSGNISTDGNIGSVVIVGNMAGGSGANSASFEVGGKIGSFSVNNMIGYTMPGDTTGMGAGSASVLTGNNSPAKGGVGSITIKGSLEGGDGNGSAEFSEVNVLGGDFGSVRIGGKISGGIGNNSGELSGNGFGAISVGQGIFGSTGDDSGSIVSGNGITSVAVLAGGITGGAGTNAGAIEAGTAPTSNGAEFVTSITVHGDISSNAPAGAQTTNFPGQIYSGVPIGSFTLYGSLQGSAGNYSGSVVSSASLGHLSVFHNGSDPGSLIGGAGANSAEITAQSIGSVYIAGQLQGYNGTGTDGAGSATVVATSTIGAVTIGDGIAGGTGSGSGAIITGSPTSFGASLTSLTITKGGITGGGGANSGEVNIGGSIGFIHVTGAIAGAGGASSGAILATDSIGSISATSLTAGSGPGSGEIMTGGNLTSLSLTGVKTSATTVTGIVDINGHAGTISVKGDVLGSAANTGLFEVGGGIGTFSISGALLGGTGTDSGAIFAGLDGAGSIGSLTISGGVIGNSGAASGEVFVGGGITQATLGDVIGGANTASGSVVTGGAIGSMVITGTAAGQSVHGIVGDTGDYSGVVSAGTSIGSLTVHGSVAGGSGQGSGAIVTNSSFTPTGDVQGNAGAISISGSVSGGGGQNSGQVSVAGNITSLSITGSVTGANNPATAVSGTGAILAGTELTGVSGGNIGALRIGGALSGGSIAANTGVIDGSGYIQAGHIGSAVIGSIQAGTVASGNTVTDDGAIRAANDIASLTVTGAITGQASNAVLVTAVGQLNPGKVDLALGHVSVGGAVSYTNFLAGYDQSTNLADGAPVNGAASIGTVVVGGDWSGSNLVAAVLANSTSGDFGAPASLITASKTVIPSIASIIIKGHVTSAPGDTSANKDTYGFVAKVIDSLSIAGKSVPFAFGQVDPVDQSQDAAAIDVTTVNPA